MKIPYKYQVDTVNFIQSRKSALLAVEMGLGKTASVLHYINWRKPKSVLIVAPKRVVRDVWVQETLNDWKPSLSSLTDKMQIVLGTKKQRHEQLLNDKPYKIVSRDNLKDLFELGLTSFELLVIDELTSFKNPTSKRTQLVNQIEAKKKVGLTGTPTANSLIDLFSQVAVLGMDNVTGKRGGRFVSWRASNFRDSLAGSGLQFSKWVPIRSMEEIISPYKDNIFTLKAEDYLDIPEVTYKYHKVELPKVEMDEYRSMESFMTANMGLDTGLDTGLDMDGTIVVDEASRFMKLQTLCNGFVYMDDGDGGVEVIRRKSSAKLEVVADFITRAVAENEQVLVFYAFKAERDWLLEMLNKEGIRVGDADDVSKWNNKEIDVMLTHPASAGHGLNLHESGARLIVWSSITYSFEYWKQANARLLRQGQKNGVQIHVFGTVGTVESKKYLSVMRKDGVNEEFLDLTK